MKADDIFIYTAISRKSTET